jgi:hypothetical protein
VTKRRNPAVGMRGDVRKAIERAWPDGAVEMIFDSDSLRALKAVKSPTFPRPRLSLVTLLFQCVAASENPIPTPTNCF